ncbi:hypothetical protein ACFFSW_07560 [Saccharothrix longispora]|uniref:Uncharacterized protein n=1 Tax=Saccharothrix longispora TaxID=33920 RepID=A0ABU1PNY3_9PSEU|nr:hypothetical protein [Saccharothrix longispora]MDR6591789.1 hypothetical protein [Saccharothrix longispora]
MRAVVAHRRNAAGAAALHQVAPEQAVQAIRERIANGLPVEAPDRLVVRDLPVEDVRVLREAYRRNPGSLPFARMPGWTGTDEARKELMASPASPNAESRRVAVIGLAASFGTELDPGGSPSCRRSPCATRTAGYA